jgi:hypothetical protein
VTRSASFWCRPGRSASVVHEYFRIRSPGVCGLSRCHPCDNVTVEKTWCDAARLCPGEG